MGIALIEISAARMKGRNLLIGTASECPEVRLNGGDFLRMQQESLEGMLPVVTAMAEGFS